MNNLPQTLNIFLIGPMGVGKSSVGKLLAKKLKWTYLDIDTEITRRTGVTIVDIFDIEGESGFRKRETAIFKELTGCSQHVISTGGGAVLYEANRSIMQQSGTIVYMHALPEVLWARLRYDTSRPLLQQENPLYTLTQLIEERDPIYRALADWVIDSPSNAAASNVSKNIYQWVKNKITKLP